MIVIQSSPCSMPCPSRRNSFTIATRRSVSLIRMFATFRMVVGPSANGASAANVMTVSEIWCMSTSIPLSFAGPARAHGSLVPWHMDSALAIGTRHDRQSVMVMLTGDFCPFVVLRDSATHLRQHVHKAVVALQRPLIQVWHRNCRACGGSYSKWIRRRRCVRFDDCLATCTPTEAGTCTMRPDCECS
eukprot:COSAG02_NODE_7490_length_2989_cov_3.247751_3_plen_188_part_00